MFFTTKKIAKFLSYIQHIQLILIMLFNLIRIKALYGDKFFCCLSILKSLFFSRLARVESSKERWLHDEQQNSLLWRTR